MASNLPDPAARPEAALERGNLATFVRGACTRCRLEQAALIDLVYLHEKPLREAARIVGIPLNTVKSRMFLARKKLAELLSTAGIETAYSGRAAW